MNTKEGKNENEGMRERLRIGGTRTYENVGWVGVGRGDDGE